MSSDFSRFPAIFRSSKKWDHHIPVREPLQWGRSKTTSRPPAWSRKPEQLFTESISLDYDIPRMYWRAVNRLDETKYEVIDGQQRLRAIWEYRADQFGLAKDAAPVGSVACTGRKYSDLGIDISTIFDAYAVDVDVDGRCCRTLAAKDSNCETMRLDGVHEQAIPCPLPNDELVQRYCGAEKTRFAVDLVGQGDDLARAA
ncbi:MAG: DUF262 domain-containing protein [Cypionkella sp.]